LQPRSGLRQRLLVLLVQSPSVPLPLVMVVRIGLIATAVVEFFLGSASCAGRISLVQLLKQCKLPQSVAKQVGQRRIKRKQQMCSEDEMHLV
uniref:Uncharacterized protein n=1 Tax=Aegilops tauschii subsp. strangulata TaxID=200361 RepID=A0A453A4H7_AEGTS